MNELFVVGVAIFLGYVSGKLVARVKIPAVTGYIIAGIIIGVFPFKLIPEEWNLKLTWLIEFALLLVAFNIGGQLDVRSLRKLGRPIVFIVLGEALGAYFLIFLTMLLLKVELPLSLLIAAIGSATAPAVTVLVLEEYRARGPLTQTLLACVGIDDAIGLSIYSISASLAHSLFSGEHLNLARISGLIAVDITVSVGVGVLFGLLLSWLLRYARYQTEFLTLTLGVLVLMGGILSFRIGPLHFSPLLGSMSLGFYIVNFSARRREAFRAFDPFGYPFYTIYFVLAGARLKVRFLIKLGWISLAYIVSRLGGKIAGAFIGGLVSKAPAPVRNYTGFGLFSQAGIAIALCIVAAQEFPNVGDVIVSIGLGTTVVTEIVGPLSTKFAITKAGELGKRAEGRT